MLLQIPTDLATPPTDKTQFLVWSIGILVLVIITLFALFKNTNNKLEEINKKIIADKDKQIEKLEINLKEAEHTKEKIISELIPALNSTRDVLHDLVSEFK